jgi:competence protein ComEC
MRIFNPFLYYAVINRIDSLIISHGDIDHINAIPEITEYCQTTSIFANDAFFTKAKKWSAPKFLIECLKENGLDILASDEKTNPAESAGITFLWPDVRMDKYEKLSENDKSLVCLLEFAGKKVLLCSDIEKTAQTKLLHLYPDLKADIVIAPHHGSTKTLVPGFIENLQPLFLIQSSGQRQFENSPFQTDKIKSFCTARDGAITIRIQNGGKINIETFINKKPGTEINAGPFYHK